MSPSKEKLKEILLAQWLDFQSSERGVAREKLAEAKKHVASPQVVLITGLRRCGKSTLASQLADALGAENYYYTNFEDDRLSEFKAEDFEKLLETLIEQFGKRKIFIFDEVQVIEGWEKFVRRMSDSGNKFFITGSNATLLSRELGTKLTGRNTTIELYPFSFKEFLDFKNFQIPEVFNTSQRADLNLHLNEYIRAGGIPLPLKYPELEILRDLFRDVINRDIVIRYKLDSPKPIRNLANYLYNNPATLQSYSKLKQLIQIKNVTTIKNYLDYLEQAWLCFTVPLYSLSIKQQQLAPKKVCLIDSGFIHKLGVGLSSKSGRIFENLAFLHLRRSQPEIYYYLTSSGREVDFYLPQQQMLYQVCEDLSEPDTFERETRALSEALAESPGTRGVIITTEDDRQIEVNGQKIEVIPVHKFLLK